MRRVELAVLYLAFVACLIGGWFLPAIWLLDVVLFALVARTDGTNLFSWHRRLTFLGTLADSNLLFCLFLTLEVVLFPVTFVGYVITGMTAARTERRLRQARRVALLEARAGFLPPYAEKTCIHCGHVEKFTGSYCPRCGKAQEPDAPQLKLCRQCGAANYASAAFCSACAGAITTAGRFELVDPNR